MLQPFKLNVVWAFLAKKWRHQTLLYSGFSGKIGKMEYLRCYFNRLTTSYKCGTWLIRFVSSLYQITMRKKFDFLFLTTLIHPKKSWKPVGVLGRVVHVVRVILKTALKGVFSLDKKPAFPYNFWFMKSKGANFA